MFWTSRQHNNNATLALWIFDGSSKTGRIRKIPEEFQKNSPLPTGDSDPPAHPRGKPGSAKNDAIGRNVGTAG